MKILFTPKTVLNYISTYSQQFEIDVNSILSTYYDVNKTSIVSDNIKIYKE